MGTLLARWAWLPLIAPLIALAIVLRPATPSPPVGAQEATETPTPRATPYPPGWNELALDADPSTAPVDASATRPLGGPFEVGVNITLVQTPYHWYQAKVQFNPSVLAYDDPPGVTYTGLGDMTLDASAMVGPDYVYAGSARVSGTTTASGQAHRIGFTCVATGTSPLHLVTMVEDPSFGSTTGGLCGVPLDTSLVDASVTCADITPTPSSTPTDTPTPTNTPTPAYSPTPGPGTDTDGDGCADLQEINIGFDPFAWYDFYDVAVPANADMTPNGPTNQAISMADVLAVLFYVGTYDGGSPNANGVAYDSVKGSCDVNADTVPDKEGLCYDRSPGPDPNPPWDAGPPNGAVSMADVLAVLAQAGLSCAGPP